MEERSRAKKREREWPRETESTRTPKFWTDFLRGSSLWEGSARDIDWSLHRTTVILPRAACLRALGRMSSIGHSSISSPSSLAASPPPPPPLFRLWSLSLSHFVCISFDAWRRQRFNLAKMTLCFWPDCRRRSRQATRFAL